MLRIMRSHTVKLNTARQAQCVQNVRLLRVFVFLFGKRAWGPSRFVPLPLFQQLFAIPTVCCHLYLSTIERADATNSDSQRTILADAAHGPPSRTCTAVPSWADSALRCIKLQEKALRAHVELSVFLRRVMTRGLRGESETPSSESAVLPSRSF